MHCCVQNTGCKGIIKTLLYSRVWEQRWIENWHECVFDVCRKSGFWWRERERGKHMRVCSVSLWSYKRKSCEVSLRAKASLTHAHKRSHCRGSCTHTHTLYIRHVQSVVIINHAISSPQIRVTEIHCICGISPTIQRGCTTALFNVSPDGRLGEGGIESMKLCVQHGVRTLNRALKSAPLWSIWQKTTCCWVWFDVIICTYLLLMYMCACETVCVWDCVCATVWILWCAAPWLWPHVVTPVEPWSLILSHTFVIHPHRND